MPKDFDLLLPDRLDALNERQFQRTVIEIGGYYGYTDWYHTGLSIKSKPGFPDLAMFNPEEGGSLYLEVKAGKNWATPDQIRWLWRIRCAGIHAYVMRHDYVHLLQGILNGTFGLPLVGSGAVDADLARIAPVPEGAELWAR